MVRDYSSNKHSKENYDLLDGMKRYLRIEHQDDDKKTIRLSPKTGRPTSGLTHIKLLVSITETASIYIY
jgi:hypothetical protein